MKAVFVELPAFERHQESEFLLFTIYAKGEMDNLTPEQCKMLAQQLQWLKASRRQS
jgi:hypothetical protein